MNGTRSSPGESFMRRAIDEARRGIENGQTPFGAVIVREDAIIAAGHNRVHADNDISAHAEIVAIRAACRATGGIDLHGCTIYSTCEPCPMCFSGIHWARIGRIVFGASITDAAEAGFREMPISNRAMADLGRTGISVVGGCLAESCVSLFREWKDAALSHPY